MIEISINVDIFRWQPLDEPIDPRYIGDSFEIKTKHGLHADENETGSEEDNDTGDGFQIKSMSEMKKEWGFWLPQVIFV